MSLQIERGRIKWQLDPVPAVSVQVDAKRAERVVQNLITHAVKFASDGGAVHVSFEVADEYVEIFVRDEGDGIPFERQNNLFSLGERAGSEREGHGFGLHSSLKIAERMGGGIRLVQSEVGRGSLFVAKFARA